MPVKKVIRKIKKGLATLLFSILIANPPILAQDKTESNPFFEKFPFLLGYDLRYGNYKNVPDTEIYAQTYSQEYRDTFKVKFDRTVNYFFGGKKSNLSIPDVTEEYNVGEKFPYSYSFKLDDRYFNEQTRKEVCELLKSQGYNYQEFIKSPRADDNYDLHIISGVLISDSNQDGLNGNEIVNFFD